MLQGSPVHLWLPLSGSLPAAPSDGHPGSHIQRSLTASATPTPTHSAAHGGAGAYGGAGGGATGGVSVV